MIQLLVYAVAIRKARLGTGNERGQTMAEYAALLAVIALIVVVVAALLGTNLSGIFSNTAHKV